MDALPARATVMGLGRFGGGAGVTRWLAAEGVRVRLTDLADAATLAPALEELRPLVEAGVVELRLGGHDPRDFTDTDLVVANPAVPRPWANPHLQAARAAGVPVTTEIRLLVERLDRTKVVGVTGSAGKSTTAAMVHHLLARDGGRARLGGNIGGSLLPELSSMTPDDVVVLEISSAMLYWLGPATTGPGWSPHVAVLTNLDANHLDWHGTLEHYIQCKEQIFANQRTGDHAIRAETIGEDPPIHLAIPGAHNQRNAWMACHAAAAITGVDPATLTAHLQDFRGLPHRLALVATRNGRRFYDDSKSTTPAAAVLAVHSFPDPGRVHLIAGGYDKGSDLSAIADLTRTLAGLYTVGVTGPGLAARGGDNAFPCETLATAVRTAVARSEPGDIVLLSPGCASWDQFANYEARGQAFQRLAEEVAMPAGTATRASAPRP
ncbi:MAG: UDP-N-acetylmuramoyl-L-alanine--D-glutamate ligase [Phycisphaerales bacterium]|nr:UDP-N-acetylmuramoyl-L-alanine--D-glutamate ligase [Phycisphaerae bacterium]NNF44491.1 UDP-N-acetylmuramoyl-L-alanine--D-glutamate ligase [Phycisphaerales bacterium]NNM26706.1 UDP-N-acetylmuramoyl-L-alanine--D-glutamate ligase [Phycisphaerales bacterium]